MTIYFGQRFGDPDAGAMGTQANYDSSVSEWNSYTPPPVVDAGVPDSKPSSGIFDSLASIFKSTSAGVQSVASGLVNIRGQSVTYAPPPPPPTPIWVYLLIPVGVIGVLVAVKKSRRSSVAGYRKRRSRRSRR